MEILDLRLISRQDLEPLLQEERTLWRDFLRWDFSSTAAMVIRFLEAHALTGYAAVEDGRAVAYSFFVYENHKGLLGDAFVSPSFRDGVTEVRLLTHVLETLQATPGIQRVEAQLLQLDGAGVRELFRSQGFRVFDRRFLFLGLSGTPAFFPPSALALEVRPWEMRWFTEAAGLITRAYHDHVDSAISDQYWSQAGATRFLENIIHYPGCGAFLPEASYLAFSPGASSPCGMILTSVVSDRVAHITQLCVAPEMHGRGAGRWLITHGLRALRDRGFQAVTLTVTASNARALRLYEQFGFTTLAVFPAFAWDSPAVHLRAAERKAAIRSAG
ncbi:MAG TPA: GNAT family N-acetyltransferase [Terriglobales bacterium]|jgi:ribosomal protein S18 acetylase RimI-like enzyme